MKIEDEPVRPLGDEHAIRDLVARYADAVSRNDVAAWSDTWIPDAHWCVGGQSSHGRDDLVQTFERLMALFEIVVQTLHNGRIAIEGDRARGCWYVSEHGRTTGGERTDVLGRYEDEYVRCPDGWKFSSRSFEFLLHD